jgi:signal peptidase I
MRRVIKSIKFWILTVVLTTVAVVTIGYLVPIPYLSPMVRGEKFVVVIDSSMKPTIKDGATVSYADFPFEQLQVGDIILYRVPGRDALIVARIVEVTQEGLRTKGDSNVAPHPYLVTAKDYIGKIINIYNLP